MTANIQKPKDPSDSLSDDLMEENRRRRPKEEQWLTQASSDIQSEDVTRMSEDDSGILSELESESCECYSSRARRRLHPFLRTRSKARASVQVSTSASSSGRARPKLKLPLVRQASSDADLSGEKGVHAETNLAPTTTRRQKFGIAPARLPSIGDGNDGDDDINVDAQLTGRSVDRSVWPRRPTSVPQPASSQLRPHHAHRKRKQFKQTGLSMEDSDTEDDSSMVDVKASSPPTSLPGGGEKGESLHSKSPVAPKAGIDVDMSISLPVARSERPVQSKVLRAALRNRAFATGQLQELPFVVCEEAPPPHRLRSGSIAAAPATCPMEVFAPPARDGSSRKAFDRSAPVPRD